MENIKNTEKPGDLKRVLLYILITYSISWPIWFFVNNVAVETLAACAPSITGFILIRFSRSGSYKGFGKRMVDFRLIRFKWYLVIILTIPAITALALITQKLSGGIVTSLDPLKQNIARPLIILLFVLWGLGAGIGEELGWRGFLLDTLQKYLNKFTSSLIVGVVWAAWHIPFSIVNNQSIFSADFINYAIFIILISVIMAVIYNNNNRSLLSTVLFHGMVNATQYIFFMNNPATTELSVLKTVYLLVVAVVLLLICKKESAAAKRIKCLFN